MVILPAHRWEFSQKAQVVGRNVEVLGVDRPGRYLLSCRLFPSQSSPEARNARRGRRRRG
jgi:hypothetical protein